MTTIAAPRVAVLYATAQGSTRDIAEFVWDDLVTRGATAELHDVEHAPDLSNIDAVVIGSAIHNMDLLPEARAYVRHNLNALADKDVWLFTVGLGPALRGPVGRWYCRRIPRKVAAVIKALHPRDYTALAGKYEREGVSWRARAVYRMLGGARYGDLRDWQAVREWSTGIGTALALLPASVSAVHP